MKANQISQEEFNNIIALYQQLTIDQCKELFLRQRDSIPKNLKNKLYSLIGAKYVYGEDYVPNKNRPVKK